jgi:energy-coupling factor transport system substrate-specific component
MAVVDTQQAAAFRRRRPLWTVLLFVLVGTLVNLGLHLFNDLLSLPLFLDSIGTAAVAALLGIVPGMIVAAATVGLMEWWGGFPNVYGPFVVCAFGTAVIVGWSVERGRFRDLFDVVVVALLVTLFNAICGAVIATFLFGGMTGATIDYLVTGFLASGRTIFSAAFWARVPASLVDKTLSVLVAWLLVRRFGSPGESARSASENA